ncbi:MAG TPA: hypothetical protein VGA99_09660, partial [bacterium]
LGFSLGSLLKGAGEIQKTAEEITFYRPKLTLSYHANKESRPDVNLSLDLTVEQEEHYRSLIKEYNFIKKITISDGEILIREAGSGQSTRVAKQINGWAYTDDNARAWLRVAGHLFESKEYNMVIYGQFNLDRGRLDFVNVDLHDYKLSDEIPFLIPHYIEVLDGTVNGHLKITERHKPTRGFNIDGDLSLTNGQLKLDNENLYFDDINLAAEIKDWNLYIKNASQTINGSPTRLQGRLKNLLAPELDLRLTSGEFDVDQFLRKFLPEKNIPIRGHGRIALSFSDSFSAPQITGIVEADSLWLNNYKLVDFETNLKLKNLALAFEDITVGLKNAEISGNGAIDFLSPDKLMDFKLVLMGDFTSELQNLGIPSADHCVGQSRIQIFGPLTNPVSRGEFKLFFTEESTLSLAVNGSFTYSSRQLTLNAASNDNQFHFNISAENLFKAPKYSIDARNLENLFVFVDQPELAFIRDHYHLNLSAEGSRNKPYVVVTGYRKDNYEKLFEITTDTTSGRSRSKIIGDIVLFPNSDNSIPGDFEIDLSDQGIKVSRVYLGDRQSGSIEMSQQHVGAIDGALLITGFKFSRLNALLGEVLPEIEGELFGKIDITESGGKSHYLGELWLFNGFIKDSGPYKAQTSFSASSSQFVCRQFGLEKTGGVSVLATGEYNFSTKEVAATVAAHEVSVGELIYLITGDDEIVDGQALVQVTLKGRAPNVPLYGRVDIRNTKILMFDFEEGLLDFGDEAEGNGSYLSKDALRIGNAMLSKSDKFTLAGPVILPFNSNVALDLRMSGNGDFLSMLSDIDPYFEKTSSEGHLNLYMSGEYTRPTFTNSQFTCRSGVMQLASVASKIENIESDLRVLPDDYFLDIMKLQGTIRNAPFSISNTNLLTGLNHGIYEPLRVAGDDLNLGAIILKTGSHGVPVNIPALMESGDIGWYELAGKDSLEDFFVAGPWAHPMVRGEVRIRNANLMFPFAESAGDGDEYTLVQKILDNLNWDVRALPKKDTRYVRQFATTIYVNMEVDPENSVLNFNGMLSDSTFRIGGQVESTRGEFEYVDLTFRVDKFGAEFDPSSLYPVVYGKAWTVVRDTANVPSDVYLELYTVDDVTSREVTKARWDRLNIKLSSEFPAYAQSQKDIMAILGYSSDTVEKQATKAVGYSTDKFIFRPIMRPIERQLERRLGLDVVRFSYALTRNFLDANLNDEELTASLALLRSSRV